jgi:hypothetical protein
MGWSLCRGRPERREAWQNLGRATRSAAAAALDRRNRDRQRSRNGQSPLSRVLARIPGVRGGYGRCGVVVTMAAYPANLYSAPSLPGDHLTLPGTGILAIVQGFITSRKTHGRDEKTEGS